MMEQKNYKKVEQSYELRTTSYELIKDISMKKVIMLLSFILLVSFTAKSQETIMDESIIFNNFIGLKAGVGLISYTGSASFFNDRDDCDPYSFNSKSGFEANFLFGLKAEFTISRSFDFYASLLYEGRSAKFEPQEYTEYVYVSEAKPLELGSFEQSLDAKVNVFSINPMIKYKPFRFDFGILVGPSVSFIVSDKLDANELILEPAELFFQENSKKERSIYSGEIESKNTLLVDLKFGLSYGFMLTEKIKLSPEIFYVLPLTKVNSVDDWKISSIQFLVSFSHGF